MADEEQHGSKDFSSFVTSHIFLSSVLPRHQKRHGLTSWHLIVPDKVPFLSFLGGWVGVGGKIHTLQCSGCSRFTVKDSCQWCSRGHTRLSVSVLSPLGLLPTQGLSFLAHASLWFPYFSILSGVSKWKKRSGWLPQQKERPRAVERTVRKGVSR